MCDNFVCVSNSNLDNNSYTGLALVADGSVKYTFSLGTNIIAENIFDAKTLTFTLIIGACTNSKYPQKVYVQGSNDLNTWTELYSKQSTSASVSTLTDQAVNINGYKYIKLLSNSSTSTDQFLKIVTS